MIPDCSKCRFFVPGRYARTDTCSRFVIYRGRGKLLYEWAETARFKESKCGEKGKLFVARDKDYRDSPIIDVLTDDD
jgi:hypothetical protein